MVGLPAAKMLGSRRALDARRIRISLLTHCSTSIEARGICGRKLGTEIRKSWRLHWANYLRPSIKGKNSTCRKRRLLFNFMLYWEIGGLPLLLTFPSK